MWTAVRHRVPDGGRGKLIVEQMTRTEIELTEKIRTGRARVAVIGLGYVGLPLATAFAEAGLRVDGLDVDGRKVSSIMEGVSYIDDINGDTFARQVEEGRLRATTDPAILSE